MTAGGNFAVFDDARLYYEDSGHGSPVVLIHGYPLDCRLWDGTFDKLSLRHRVLRYDLRGYGRSSLPDTKQYSHVVDLRRMMDHVGFTEAQLVGFSMGGRISLDFALSYTDMIRSLVLVGSPVSGFQWPRSGAALRAIWETGRNEGIEPARRAFLDFELIEPTKRKPRPMSKLGQMVNEYSGWDWVTDNPEEELQPPAIDRLGDIKCPLLVMIGEHDLLDLRAISSLLLEQIPGSTEVVFQDVGHFVPLEAPQKFNLKLFEFLSSNKGF